MSPRALDPAVATIVSEAAACSDLSHLTQIVRSCSACTELAATRTNVVVGDTPSGARLLLVGEAPGATEDVEGRPFVGKAGQLLNLLMTKAGLQRDAAAVLNVVKCRPPGNRTPSRVEAARCTGWLDRQVELLGPDVVVVLGRTALTWALGASTTIEPSRGVVHDWGGRRLIVTYHPSAAIRFGPKGAPRLALETDLRLVATVLGCD